MDVIDESNKTMTNAILYIHGKDGSAKEADHYKKLFPSCYVTGLAYTSPTSWEAKKEIKEAIRSLKRSYRKMILIASSIGAFFSMHADIEKDIERAYFISPIVDMESLITDMMNRVNITELELKEKGSIKTDLGEDLSWEYLCYVRDHPIQWNVPTNILYGSEDSITSLETITTFAKQHNRSLTVMEKGEHWFHTDEQMAFLDEWITQLL